MIGTILSMRYIGKQPWIKSIVFWVVYLIVASVASYGLSLVSQTAGMVGFAISAGIFIALAHYWKWFNFPWIKAVKVFVVAFVIDLIIIFVIFAILFAAIGFTIPWEEMGGTGASFVNQILG